MFEGTKKKEVARRSERVLVEDEERNEVEVKECGSEVVNGG